MFVQLKDYSLAACNVINVICVHSPDQRMRIRLEVAAVAALVVLSAATVTVGEQEKHTLYFVSFLPYLDQRQTFQATWQDAEEIVTSGYLALDHINNRTDILKDYTIRLIESDGGCNLRTRTVVGFAESGILSSSKQIVGVVGPSCGDSSVTVAPLTSQNEIALTTVHYGQFPQLGDRKEYPYAFGILDSFDVYAKGVTELMKNRMWKRVAILYTDKDLEFFEKYRNTEKQINQLPDYEIAFSSVVFETYLPLKGIKNSFAPVIVVFAGEEITKLLLCMAYHEGMVYPTYQWVFTERRISEFANTSFSYSGQKYTCTAAEMMNVAVNGGIGFVPDVSTTKDSNTTVSGQSYEEYLHNYQEKAKMRNASTTDWANPYYDAIWALALALNASLQELQNRNFSLTEYGRGKPNITDIIADHMYKLDFEGVSGRIKFEQETGFNNRTLIGYQFINGSEEKAGVYSSGKLVLYSQEFVRGEFEPRYDRVAIPVAVVLLLLIVITLPPTIMAQIINVMRPDYRTIKASSPRINHIGFVGYYLLVMSIILHTITVTFWLSDGTQGVLCNLVPWFMSIGLSLMLGTVFLKTWRIYNLFHISEKLIRIKRGPQVYIHKDYFLAFIILLQPTVDVLICTLWVVMDPYTSLEREVFQYKQGVPVVVHQKICKSQLTPYWLFALSGHKVILMLSSLFFAILARRVRRKQFKTKNVTILVYLLSITCGLGIPLYLTTYFIEFDINIPYFLLCATLATLLYLCLTLLFLPPLYPLLKERLMHHGVWPNLSSDWLHASNKFTI